MDRNFSLLEIDTKGKLIYFDFPFDEVVGLDYCFAYADSEFWIVLNTSVYVSLL